MSILRPIVDSKSEYAENAISGVPGTGRSVRTLADRHPSVVFYVLSLSLSGMILTALWAVGSAQDLFFLATFGPGVAAVVTVGMRDDRSAAWQFTKEAMRWRLDFRWWAATILLPLATTVAALVMAAYAGGVALDPGLWSGLAAAIPLLLVNTLFNGIPEELGWRGFMLPLAQRHRSALQASLIVGFWWGLWHLPLFFIKGTFQATFSEQLGFWVGLVLWTFATMAFSIGFTWLFNGVGGSALAAGVLHGATNVWIGRAASDATSSESVELFAWYTVVWIGVALGLSLVNGTRTLTRSGRKIVKYVG